MVVRSPCDRCARSRSFLLSLLFPLLLVGAACAGSDETPAAVPDWRDEPPRLIAHGGGAWDAVHVTNSLQALDRSAAEEFLLIEVDLSWTSDGHLVLLHDWDGAFQAMFGLEPGPRSLEAFLGLQTTNGLQQLGLDALATWMAAHPRVGIVTDIKTERLRGLEILADRLAAVRTQVVPQVHDELELHRARALGFDAVILTLYASSLSDDEVLELVRREPLYAVTVPKERALTGLARRLADAGVATFAHTVNNQLMATRLVRAGAHGVYTDRLTPARSRRDARAGDDTWTFASEPGDVVPGDRAVLVVDLWDSLDARCGTLVVRPADGAASTAPVKLEAFMDAGSPPRLVDVATGAGPVPLDTLFPDALPRWIAAPPGVELELRWQLLDRPQLIRTSTREVPSAWSARGPVDEFGGLALFLLNPGTESRTVEVQVGKSGGETRVLTRRIEAGAVHVERMPLEGEAGLLELSVTGGGVVVHLLRAGPECSVVR